MKPTILIIEKENNTLCALNKKLSEAIEGAGGQVVACDGTKSLEELIAGADGVLLADGDAFLSDETFDGVEFRACEICRERRMPILGIGRGMQALNIYTGGNLTLKMQGEQNHIKKENEKPTLIPHTVSVTLDTFIAYNPFKAEVNSAHSQCLKLLGESIRVVAVAEDGVAEAIEHKKLPWTGVQWHPEYLDGACGNGVFEHFIALAREFKG